MRDTLNAIAAHHRNALLEDVIPFWQRHSVDREHGGFFTLLDRRGELYGSDKPIWLQGRQAWMFATLYLQIERRPEWLDLARQGCNFLVRHGYDAGGKLYFLVDRTGRPLRMRRYAYSEVFAAIAFAALAAATGEREWAERALATFEFFLAHTREPGRSEPKTDPRTRPMKGLAPLMCVLSTADELIRTIGPMAAARVIQLEAAIDSAAEEILRDFVKPDRGCVLETVGPDGEVIEGPDGRVMNPGHAIECAWFLLHIAHRRGDDHYVKPALAIFDDSIERGWDSDYGGLYSFIDVDGRPPTQLEHDMKLWWPHNEATIAALMAFRATNEARYLGHYSRIYDWSMAHFADPEHGEWFGYLHRDGSVSTPLKGGIWKGCFHLPRMHLMCANIAADPIQHDSGSVTERGNHRLT